MAELKEAKESPETLKLKLEEIKKKAIDARESAIHEARQAHDQAKEKIEKSFDDAYVEQTVHRVMVDQNCKKTQMMFEAIMKNKTKQWSDMWLGVKTEYEQLISAGHDERDNAEEEHEKAIQAAVEQFSKTYAELQQNKLDAENKYEDVLQKGRTEYENAMQAAAEIENQAEEEFREVANKYNTLSTEDLAEAKAKYEAEMEKYEKAVKLADKKWQDILDKTGTGTQYEEALDKAFVQLLKGKDQANSIESKLMAQSEKDFQAAEELQTKIKNQINDDHEKVLEAHREALEKAENEHIKALQNIQKKVQKTMALRDFDEKVAQLTFDRAIDKANTEFEKIMEEINNVVISEEKTITQSPETVPEKVATGGAGRKKRAPAPRKKPAGTKKQDPKKS